MTLGLIALVRVAAVATNGLQAREIDAALGIGKKRQNSRFFAANRG